MVKIRQEKVDKIADHIPEQKLDSGPDKGKILVLGWGSTYGAIKIAVAELQAKGHASKSCTPALCTSIPEKPRAISSKISKRY